jgi:hypothetical protein
MNTALQVAGEKYAEHWHNGTPSVGAMDPSKSFVSDSRTPAYFQSEWQLGEWQEWLNASLQIYPKHRAMVESVVLHDRMPADIARMITGRADEKTGVAIVMDRLICGLGDLAQHYVRSTRRTWRGDDPLCRKPAGATTPFFEMSGMVGGPWGRRRLTLSAHLAAHAFKHHVYPPDTLTRDPGRRAFVFA